MIKVPASAVEILPPAKGSSTFKIRIDDTAGVHINDTDYVKYKKTDRGYLLRRLDMPDLIEEFSFEALQQLLDDECLAVTHNYHSSRSAAGRLNSDYTYLSDLPESRQTPWAERLEIVEAFLIQEANGVVSRSDASLGEFIKRWFDGKVSASVSRFGQQISVESPPHPSSVRRWVRAFEACDLDPASLIDGYGRSGNHDARLSPEASERMQGWVEKYQSNLKPSMSSLYRLMRADFRENARHLSVPSRNTFERRIKRLDPFHVMAAREGEAVAKRKLYAVRDRVDVSRPMQRVEMDEQTIPLQTMLVERGLWDTLPEKLKAGITHARWKVSKMVDHYSRVVVAFIVTPSASADSALATLKMALEDKTALARAMGCATPWDMYGLPELIVTDSGSNFRSKKFRAAVLDLGSSIMIAPAGLPQMRGVIERSFRTDSNQIYSQFPGRSFKDVVEKGEYDSEANIVATITELCQVSVRYWVDVYHNSPHAGLGGDTPRNRWMTGVERFGVLPPPPRDVMRHIFSTVVECRVGNRGVRIAGLFFQSKDLQNARRTIRSRSVLVRVDTDNLGHVSVKTDEGWLTVPCSTVGFDGVSLFRWRHTQAELRRRYAEVAALSEDIVNKALLEMHDEVERLRLESNVPSPIMSSKDLIAFDRDLARGFDMIRPENGEVGKMPEEYVDYTPHAVSDEAIEDVPSVQATPATFFTE